ncbi:hypothetical protein AK812_SmicGene38147 [Symbiodinium microadriaticum]|uniref:Protein kinase domain-containing protein n=1 Tax=Symbiodinium microadriaticum TaxID=2951 RepID=A0A1Q9CEH8_SYMMI|nr:hypothetical protein AK812_SmicGene38147 [Symbiodinium microadriaticum]CAE7943782.1 unnamed protein product [Symbiodinium sp. KB8]
MVARKELECRAAWHRMSPPRSVSHHGRAGSIRCTGPLRSIRSKCRSMKADSIASFRCDTDLVRHISTGLDGLRHVMEEAASGVSQLPWKHMKQETICMTSRGIQYQDADDGQSPCSSSDFHIPLEWSDLLYTDTQIRDSKERTPTQILLVAPEVAKSVWLLFGHFDSDGLGCFLQSLSRGGAIRWDLRETYDAVRPCGQGLHGTVFVGESKVTDSDEDRVRREVRFMFQFGVEKADASGRRERYALAALSVVMELGSGGDLGALLARGALPEFRGMEIMIGVMSALAFLHRYAAPEIVEQRAHCEKVDVFGAGALWQLGGTRVLQVVLATVGGCEAKPSEPASGGISSEAKSKALVEELVVQTFCLQRLHVCGTVLTVSWDGTGDPENPVPRLPSFSWRIACTAPAHKAPKSRPGEMCRGIYKVLVANINLRRRKKEQIAAENYEESRLEADMQKKESHLQAAAKKAEAAAASSSVMKKLASIDTASVVQYKKMCGDFKSIAAYHHFIGNRDALKSSITKGVLAQKWDQASAQLSLQGRMMTLWCLGIEFCFGPLEHFPGRSTLPQSKIVDPPRRKVIRGLLKLEQTSVAAHGAKFGASRILQYPAAPVLASRKSVDPRQAT